MEFLSLSRGHSSWQNVPSGNERGETSVFIGYNLTFFSIRVTRGARGWCLGVLNATKNIPVCTCSKLKIIIEKTHQTTQTVQPFEYVKVGYFSMTDKSRKQ